MTYSKPARTAAHRTRSTILAASVVLVAALIGLASSPVKILHGGPAPAVIGLVPDQPPTADCGQHAAHPRPDRPGPANLSGAADGVVPYGVTVFDDTIPAVVNLDPALLGALRQAATDAAYDGIEFYVNSGWRSPKYQAELLREAISRYGSEEEAARWVATPHTSAHVSGDAVDIGPFEATAWLSRHGAQYGLCQIYSSESWHFELRPEAVDYGCPPMYADPTHDPRMQQ